MNIFVEITPLKHFSKTQVKIYTVHLCDEVDWRPQNEFEDWVTRYSTDEAVKTEFNDILKWIQTASRGQHDLHKLLRDEKGAHAFPPENRFLEIEYGENLRLYCMLIGRQTIILMNGAVKTKSARTAQKCPNVHPYFDEANKLCKCIENQIKDLNVNYDTGEIGNIEIEMML